MRSNMLMILTVLLVLQPILADCAKVLMILQLGVNSHKVSMLAVAENLAKRGHNVTMVSPSQENKANQNFREIFLPRTAEQYGAFMNPLHDKFWSNNASFSVHLEIFTKFPVALCRSFIEDMKDVDFLKNADYDAVILGALTCECSLLVAANITTNIIYISPHTLLPFQAYNLNIPVPTAYVPTFATPFTSKMTFLQRTVNSAINLIWQQYRNMVMIPQMEEIVREVIPGSPGVNEVERNVSLVLLNRFTGLQAPQPSLPFVQEVPGIHCRPARALSPDLEEFINTADGGFIYFSMGSFLSEEKFPSFFLQPFVEAFSRIPLRVIWKHNTSMSGLSENVKLVKWASQQDILGHRKIRAFITQGGFLSLQEAIYHAVPIIGVPVGGDQPSNVRYAEEKGIGVGLKYQELTSDSVQAAIQRILQKPSYAANVKQLSSILRDQPMSPADRAVYWIEYVIRHKGARHLHPDIDHLNFLQYFLLDIIAFCVVIIVVTVYSTVLFVKIVKKLFQIRKKQKTN